MAITWKKLAYEDNVITKAFIAAKGDLIAASGDNTPTILSVGTNDHVLTADSGQGSGVKWAAAPGAAHAILDGSTHSDSVADGVTRGSIVYGNATPKWDELVIGANETLLQSDGTDIAYATPATVAATMAMDDIGVPDAAVDFDLQEATDLVVMTVANEAGLPGANVALGQLCWATSELTLHVCTVAA